MVDDDVTRMNRALTQVRETLQPTTNPGHTAKSAALADNPLAASARAIAANKLPITLEGIANATDAKLDGVIIPPKMDQIQKGEKKASPVSIEELTRGIKLDICTDDIKPPPIPTDIGGPRSR